MVKLENIQQDCANLGIEIPKNCETKASKNYQNYLYAHNNEILEIINDLYSENFRMLSYDIYYNPVF